MSTVTTRRQSLARPHLVKTTTPSSSSAVVPKKLRSKLPLRRIRSFISPFLSSDTSDSVLTHEANSNSNFSKRVRLEEGNEKQKEVPIMNDAVSESSCVVSEMSVSCVQQPSPEVSIDNKDLVCNEKLVLHDDVEGETDDASSYYYSTSQEFSLSDYSSYFDSGSEFSERSVADESAPSPTFTLFLQYSQLFVRCAVSLGPNENAELLLLTGYARFEEMEEEENYVMLRGRERTQAHVRDYAQEYCGATELGQLIVQQRLEMVHWIVDVSATKELQKETLFLGVNLLDRFLSRGVFKTKRHLQIVAIACLSLAIRMEENQPYNCVQQKTFQVGSNIYSRCEVVAMEWLVQEVLKFQCFSPTIYNFLWFYLKAAGANTETEKIAQYLAVLALLSHEQLSFWPSTVAAAIVILACLATKQDSSYKGVTEIHVRTKNDDLQECIKSELGVVDEVHTLLAREEKEENQLKRTIA